MEKIEKTKRIILIIFISYVALFSVLIINQSCKASKYLMTNIGSETQNETLDEFDNFIGEKRNKLEEYKIKNKNKNISDKCLNSISKEVEKAYNFNHSPIKTYDDLLTTYVEVYSFSYFYEMVENCNFNDLEVEEVRKYITDRSLLIEDKFFEFLDLYQIEFTDLSLSEYRKELDLMKQNSSFGILVKLRDNEQLYLKKIFEILGDKYE